MSAPKHTPTPWVRGEPEGNDALATIRTADGETVIAEVYFVEGHGTREEAEADLAHMLAAPDLAEACEMALRDWFELHYGANDIGMAALIREKLKTALRSAGRLP